MAVRIIALFVSMLVFQALGWDLHAGEIVDRPLLLIFDASGSMKEKQGGERKIEAARRVVGEFLQRLPGNTTLGVMVYGHRRSKDCEDIEILERFAPSAGTRLQELTRKIKRLDALGETPIAASLERSIPLFEGKPGAILLVTDGKEECGGDLCAAAERLSSGGVEVRVDIVGFGLSSEQKVSLRCLHEKTGGRYYDAGSGAELEAALNEAAKDALKGGRLEITVMEGERIARSPFITVRGEDGSTVSLVDNPSTFLLPAGQYTASARVGTMQESSPVAARVEEKRTTKYTLSVGSGSLELTLTAGGKILTGSLLIELWENGRHIASVSENPARFQAPEGTYEVRLSLTGNQKYIVPQLAIHTGRTTTLSHDVPMGTLKVNVMGSGFKPGAGPWPYVEIRQNGRQVTALSDNPARFQLLAGTYEASVKPMDGSPASQPITVEIQAGSDAVAEIRLD